MKAKLSLTLALLALLTWTWPANAGDKQDGVIKVKEADVVVSQIMSGGDNAIPVDLLKKCRAVVIFPDMVKAGFIVGGQYGTGVVLAKQPQGGFGAPAFFVMGGVSAGLQIGAQAADVILLVMNDKGLKGILNNKLKFGADAAVAAGPVGRRAEAALTGANVYADVYSYSRTKGAFAGISLEGGGIDFDAETSKAYYGKALTVRDILEKGLATPPPSAQNLINTLNSYAK
ncbi:MAG: lipid-binding SYLF domain-containing protein [Thermodesulfobacteriota bacterium]